MSMGAGMIRRNEMQYVADLLECDDADWCDV